MKKVHTYQTTSPSHGNKSIREVLKAKVLLLMITAFFTLFIGHSATAQHCPNPCGWNGVGSASQPFIIATLADLNCLANAVNSGIATYDSCFFELRDDIGLMLTAIGYDANHYFGGIFDGNGHTIEVEITSINRTPAGLFGYTDNSFSGGRATIKNLTITGSVRGRDDVAGLVGYAENTYIERCYNYATVSANGNAGGFVGRAENTYIERCYNYATVSANSNAGGFIGYTGHWSSVRNCTNYANITASNDNVGGIIGSYNSAGIQQSENSGNIRGRSYVGGIAGSSVGSGGIDINTNIGIVIGTGDYVGGIVGYMSLSSQLSPMKYCHNSGYVQGYGNYIGGIVGYNTGHIHDCLNTIPVYGPAASTTIGGIVGYNDAGIINNCYYDIQMYNGVGIGSGSSTTGATGMTTTEIINYATPLVPPWIFTPDLYPRVSSTTIGYLAASPVFLLDISPDLERADSVVTDFTASIGYIDDWQSPSRNGYVTFSGTDATIGSIPSSPQPDTLVAVLDNIIRVVPIDIYQPAPPPCSVSVERIMPADEKTNASATGGFLVQFKVTITPAPTTLTSSDIILSNGSLIGVAAIGTGVWLISINVSALGLTQSDTVRIDSVNVSPCGWTVPDTDSNQFFDIRKVFLNNAYLKVPTDGATNVPVTISPIKIGFTNTEIVTVIASPNVLLTPIGGTGVLYSATFNTSDNSLEFTPNAPLDYSTPYTVTILANTIKDEWQNTKTSNIVVGSFTTEADKICIVSIERYNPTTNDDGKTNATFLIFEITFESALSGTPNATHFIFENISGSPFVVSGGGAVWQIGVVPTYNNYDPDGLLVGVVDIDPNAPFSLCDPDPYEFYNVRQTFQAEYYIAVHYDGSVPGPGWVKILSSEPLDPYGTNVKEAYSGLNYETEPPYDNKVFSLHYSYCPSIYVTYPPYLVYFDAPNSDILVDEWGNVEHIGSYYTITQLCKQSQQLASGWHSTPLLVGNVYPMPAVDNTNLDVSVYQEGNLQVSLYDLAGSKVADLMNISATANTDYSIQMRLGFLSNGVYTIMITLDNERIFKQLIINK